MASVVIDLACRNWKELYSQGIRAYALEDYPVAVQAFSMSCQLVNDEHGNELNDCLGEVYLYYGKALLALSRQEANPFGSNLRAGVDSSEEEEEEGEQQEGEDEEAVDEEGGEEVEEEGEVKRDEKNEKDKNKELEKNNDEESSKSEETEKDDVTGKKEETEKDEESEKKEEETEKTDNEKVEENGDKKEAKEGAAAEEEEEEASDIQIAWEVLELARNIFTKRGIIENGNYDKSISDLKEALKIQNLVYPENSRIIAETNYHLGLTYTTHNQFYEAIDSFTDSLAILNNRMIALETSESPADREEIEEMKKLVQEIEEKIADTKNNQEDTRNKIAMFLNGNLAATSSSSSQSNSSSQAPSNINHLVKRKRKSEEGESSEGNCSKKTAL